MSEKRVEEVINVIVDRRSRQRHKSVRNRLSQGRPGARAEEAGCSPESRTKGLGRGQTKGGRIQAERAERCEPDLGRRD